MTKDHKDFYYGVTKEEHDELLLEKARPLTQIPIQKRSQLETDLAAGQRNLITQITKIFRMRSGA